MSFSSETEKLVRDLVQAEYGNICANWGGTYNTLHEGYSILLEEIEEVREEIKHLKMDKKVFWNNIKENETEGVKLTLSFLNEDVENAMKELAQVGAVLLKIQNTINKEK